jgi:GrpB-like predicted nucleotidyltransferase (UPF0157 family)
MACPKALLLLDQYYEALKVFHDARESGNSRERDLRFAELSRARMEYWKHVESHGCRTALNGGYRLATEQKLREQMEEARKVFNDAHLQVAEVGTHGESNADRNLAFGQATQAHAKARHDYREAFKRFADYVVHGKLPGDPNS